MITGKSDSELCIQLSEAPHDREEAFAELYRRHAARIYRYARRILSSEADAEDIVQESFLRFLNSLSQGKQIENIPAYLFRIARNLSINKHHSEKGKTPLVEMSAIFEPKPVEAEEASQIIQMSLELLPCDQREALVLQVYGGLTYAEIGELMEVPVSTVRNWIVRSKAKMRVTLSRYYEHP